MGHYAEEASAWAGRPGMSLKAVFSVKLGLRPRYPDPQATALAQNCTFHVSLSLFSSKELQSYFNI